MAGMREGSTVLLRYNLPAPDGELWHERFLLASIRTRPGWYVVLTPSADLFAEQCSLANADLSGVRVAPAGGGRPVGLVGAVFSFGDDAALAGVPQGADLAGFRTDARALADVEEAADRAAAAGAGAGGGAVVPAGAAGAGPGPAPAAPPPRAPLPIAPAIAAGAAAEWRAVVSIGKEVQYGDVVPDPAAHLILNAFGLSELPSGQTVPCERVEPGNIQDFFDRAVAHDARVLPVRKLGSKRHRTWTSISSDSQEEPFDDWPLPGGAKARSTSWCLDYLVKSEENIERHHERFRSLIKGDSSTWGVQEHYNTCQSIKMLGEYDQGDLTNLASAELLFRRLQTIEFSYLEVIREQEQKLAGSSGGSKLSVEEQALFSGQARSSSSLMISPTLLEHARSETEKEASLLKNLQKVREGKEALRKNKK